MAGVSHSQSCGMLKSVPLHRHGFFMRITLRQLQVFRAICECSQASKAAKALNLSIPAISQNLKDLEQLLDTKLFVRKSTGLVPTPAADMLLPYANVILDKTQTVEEIFARRAKGFMGNIRIGANKTFGIYILSKRLPLFKFQRPEIQAKLVIEEDAKIEDQVLSNRLDIGFITGEPRRTELKSFPCYEGRHCIICAPNSTLYTPYIGDKELSAATWILDEEKKVREETLEWLARRGIKVRQFIEMNAMGAIKRAVGTGLGLAVVPFLSVEQELLRGDLAEVKRNAALSDEAQIYAVFKDKDDSGVREIFFDFCRIAPLPANR